jgi:hypothetical protein
MKIKKITTYYQRICKRCDGLQNCGYDEGNIKNCMLRKEMEGKQK